MDFHHDWRLYRLVAHLAVFDFYASYFGSVVIAWACLYDSSGHAMPDSGLQRSDCTFLTQDSDTTVSRFGISQRKGPLE